MRQETLRSAVTVTLVVVLAAVLVAVASAGDGDRHKGDGDRHDTAGAATATSGATASATANGMIAFGRFNPDLEDTQVYVINPDGSHERLVQGADETGECPTWFPDGSLIATCGAPDRPGGGSRFINPDTGAFRDVDGTYPDLFNPCGNPSPDGSLLLCETFSQDGSENGIHTIRTSTGGDLRQVTSNPGGDDVPEAWSPDGEWILFQRFEASGAYDGVFLVRRDGSGLKLILPSTTSANCCQFSWSSVRNEILFTRHVTPDFHSSIWAMRPDGSDLHQVNIQPSWLCGGANADPSAAGCPQADWSPDGTKIVFARGQNVDVDGELWVAAADGSDAVQITHSPGAQSPDWGTHPLAR
jgi:Tol biopolymer transport system component